MNETRDITLGGRVFAVPPLPLRINKAAYPLCRKLTDAGLIDRAITAGGVLVCSTDEMAELAEIAFLAAIAAEGVLARDGRMQAANIITRAAFDDLPVLPQELLDAFFIARYQTGAWVPIDPAGPKDEARGEAKGARRPRKSTSTASSRG